MTDWLFEFRAAHAKCLIELRMVSRLYLVYHSSIRCYSLLFLNCAARGITTSFPLRVPIDSPLRSSLPSQTFSSICGQTKRCEHQSNELKYTSRTRTSFSNSWCSFFSVRVSLCVLTPSYYFIGCFICSWPNLAYAIAACYAICSSS